MVDLILVFDFRTRFLKEPETLQVSEAHTFVILSELLTARSKRRLRSICNGTHDGCVACRQEAVSFLLCTYATSVSIHNAVNGLRNICQKPREEELTYSGRINDAAHWCGNCYDEVDNMTMLFNWLLPCIQTVVSRPGESKNRNILSRK